MLSLLEELSNDRISVALTAPAPADDRYARSVPCSLSLVVFGHQSFETEVWTMKERAAEAALTLYIKHRA
jgi:hypothetical protein